MEEGEVRSRDRNSNIDRRPNLHLDRLDLPMLRRGTMGNFPPYPHPAMLSPQSAGNHQVSYHHHHHHHSAPHAYPAPHISHPAANSAHFLPRPYDTFSHQPPLPSYPQRSPASSHSSDDNYDEPLQLTVRRDSGISSHSNQAHDDSNDSDQGMSGDKSASPPAPSFPHKLRHKLDLPQADELTFPKDSFPNMAAVAAVTGNPSHFPSHPFMNGLAHLSDMALSQSNPLALMKSEDIQTPPLPSLYGRHRKDNSMRRSAMKHPGDHKYQDPKYLERRRRNNEAARKCRENRKALTKLREAKSDYLESENGKLRNELNSLQEEMKQLRDLIEKKRQEQGIKEEDCTES